jgi:hypothetical protein
VVTALAAVLAWIVVEHGLPELLRVDALVGESWGALASLLVLGAAGWSVARRRWEGVLIVPFVLFRFDLHTKWALLYAVAVVVALTTRSAVSRRVTAA